MKKVNLEKASDFIISELIRNNINISWVFQGGAISHLIDSAYQRQLEKGDFSCRTIQHEQAAGFAADSYSRTSKKMPAVMVTSGPGATNLITSISCNWYDSVPVIYFAGQVRTWELSQSKQRQKGFQETNIVSIVKDIVKYSVEVSEIGQLKYELQKAIWYANEGRKGPVLISLPMNLQWELIDSSNMKSFVPPKEKDEKKLFRKEFRQVVNLIGDCKKFTCLIGAGLDEKKDIETLKKWSLDAHFPILTTYGGKQYLECEFENNMGLIGAMGTNHGNKIISETEVLLVLGCRLSWRHIRSKPETFARRSQVIHVDIDENELGANIESSININMDCSTFLNRLTKELKGVDQNFSEFLKNCNDEKKKYSYLEPVDMNSDVIHPHQVIDGLSAKAPENTTFVLDCGSNLVWSIQGLKSTGKRLIFSSWGHSPMGYSVCAGIGAYEANKNLPLVTIIGDGGLHMNIHEFKTIVDYNYPIKIVVLNNEAYGAIKDFQIGNLEKRFFATDRTNFGVEFDYSPPDYMAIAESYGLDAMSVQDKNNISKGIDWLMAKNGPCLLNVFVDNSVKMTVSDKEY